MNLREELNRLDAERKPQRRGKGFEVFLTRLLEKEGLEVTYNPKATLPLQTDLMARLGQTFFIVEAKWSRKRMDVGKISAVRDRLSRGLPDVFACVFSMAGFSEGAIADVGAKRDREIILFNGFEVRDLVDDRASFIELLDHKRRQLRESGVAFLNKGRVTEPPRSHLRTAPDVLQVGSKCNDWMRAATGFHDIVFSNEYLDCSGYQIGSLFSLRLQLGIREIADLERTLKLLRKKLGLSGQGSFAIHQGSMGWYGFGFQTFLSAVREQKARYEELKWKSYHHSEELAYVDRLDGGGLMCLSSRQGTGQGNYLHSSQAEVYLPGIPVQMSRIRELCELTGNHEALLEMVNRKVLQTVRFHPGIKVEPVAAILSDTGDGRWTSGLVIRNPFRDSSMAVDSCDEEEAVDELKRMIPACEFLFCELRQWHNPGRLMAEYELCSVEGCWIAHYYAMNVVCDWKQ